MDKRIEGDMTEPATDPEGAIIGEYYVGLVGAGLAGAGMGTLLIHRRKLELKLSPLATRILGVSEIVDTSAEVTVLEARMFFPWANTIVLLGDEHAHAGAVFTALGRRRIRRQLDQAGFRVRRQTRWFGVGITRIA